MLNVDLLAAAMRGCSDDGVREWLLGGLRAICADPDVAVSDALAPLVLTAAEPWSAQIAGAVRGLDPRDGERVRTALGRSLVQAASATDPPELVIELWRIAALLQPPGDLVTAARHVLAALRHVVVGSKGQDLADAVFAAIRTRPYDTAVDAFFEERRHAPGWRAVHARAYVLYVARREPGRWHLPVASFADELAEGLDGEKARRRFAEQLLSIVGLRLMARHLPAIRGSVAWLHETLTAGDAPVLAYQFEGSGASVHWGTTALRIDDELNDEAMSVSADRSDAAGDDSPLELARRFAMVTASAPAPDATRIRTANAVRGLQQFTRNLH